jgi:non-ribosomal peptide synthase protein (TIGR01720 family)
LLLIIHHLIVDGVSWRLLLEDLHTALDQLMQGRPVTLPSKTTAFQVWSQHIQNFASLPTANEAKNYWLSDLFRKQQPLPRDYAANEASNTVESGCWFTRGLNPEKTQALLEDVPEVYHTQINDILLTALAQTLSEWLQESSVLFALEGHGREDLFDGTDVTRTVGWFTSVFPVRLELNREDDFGKALLSVKEQLRAIPQNGVSFGLLQYSAEHGEAFKALPEPELLFNYLGRRDAELISLDRFEFESDSIGEMRFPGDRRLYLIEVNCFIRNGSFYSLWNYSRHFHKEATIQHLVDNFHRTLEALIDHCLSPQAGGHSLSDFPLADLDQDSFDQISGLLEAMDKP